MTDKISVTGVEGVSEVLSDVNDVPTVTSNNKEAKSMGGNVTQMQEYKEEVDKIRFDSYADLYEDLVSQGKSQSDAVRICKHLQAQEQKYFDTVQSEPIQIRKHFTVAWLDRHYGFTHLEHNDKNELLWNLGLDVKGKKSWHIREERARDEDRLEGNTAPLQSCVFGDERKDSAWLSMRDSNGHRVASDEAQDWVRRG